MILIAYINEFKLWQIKIYFRKHLGLPYDHNRVELDEYVGDTDYINASWIAIEKSKQPIPQNQNFSQKLIATQDPLPNTIVHFLQMITEQKIDAVVKLSKLSDDGK